MTVYVPHLNPPRMRLADVLIAEVETLGETEAPKTVIQSRSWHLRKSSEPVWLEDRARRQTFWLEPLAPGDTVLQLEPWKVKTDKDEWHEVKWDGIAIQVTSVVDNPELDSIRPLPGIEEVPGKETPVPLLWPWMLLAIGILTGATWILSRKLLRPPPAPPPTAREWSLGQLQRLVQRDLPKKGASMRYLRLLSLVLRGYLARACKVPAQRLITSDLVPALRDTCLSQTEQREVQSLLEHIDLARYARLDLSSADCADLAARVHRLIAGERKS